MKKHITVDDVTTRLLQVFKEKQGNKNDRDFAKELDLIPSTYSNYKIGRLPQLEQLIKIRNNLNLPFGYLLGEIDVTKYEDDTEETFGLTKECIRKIEELSSDEIKSLNKLIVNWPKELIELIVGYMELPIIDDKAINLPVDKNNKIISPSDFMLYKMQDEMIRKKINLSFNNLLTSLKPGYDNISDGFTKRGKEIRDKLTPELDFYYKK